MAKLLLRDPGQISFTRRVLDEVMRERNYLQSKAMFLGISASGDTELMAVRYPAALAEDPENVKVLEKAIGDKYMETVKVFKKFNKMYGLIRSVDKLNKNDRNWAEDYFKRNIFPSLTPVTVSDERKPSIHAGLYILTITEKDDERRVGYVEIPNGMGRWIVVPNRHFVIAIEDLIQSRIRKLFKGRKVVRTCPFSITRSSEVYEQSDRYTDPFELIKHTLKAREESWVTKLEIGSDKKNDIKTIRKMVPMEADTLIFASDMIRLDDLTKIPTEVYNEEDRARKFVPVSTWPDKNLFNYIKAKDRLALHPFESFDDTFVRFLEQAAEDPDVTSIRITLYRVGEKSRIVDALLKAADEGKMVTVLVELKARFDEKHNMQVATILREGGVRLIYTKPDIKTHAKICLVTRKEKKGLRIYSQIGTGNYNNSGYVDYSLFTADPDVGEELVRFFNLMTSDQEPFKPKHVIFSPHNLRENIYEEINAQKKRAKNGKSASVIMKCNALTDVDLAEKILDAADAGVHFDLIIRGACIIQPTKNISIRSIVGEFLEHQRVYQFGTSDPTIYIGSSDMMTRSLDHRYELLIKVTEPSVRKRILKHLQWYAKDTENARIIDKNYHYHLIANVKGNERLDVHKQFKKEAKRMATEG